MSSSEGTFVIGSGMLEFAKGLMRLPTQAIQEGLRRGFQIMGRFQGTRDLFDGGTWCIQGERPFSSAPGIRERLLPDPRLIKVIGYLGEVGIKRRYKELFHRFGKRAMQPLALAEQELSV